ncbi:Stk1 family PASTA domain-containing Ser/Thr kinase [Xylocopilactobacillus apis]|uniref:non-specific serine/threonine protein kinase n=1 Tax=Xylocopilactobacillus apis TaxID=2932183 RepID=A0AAU9DKR3_9LACO|nr:Stk1 family PASTA domain-containing Ser/Thr kinase [Xylocopilactobacillus apis]BDR56089.1 protein kinase [Xylocopilactobacillus apis]
MMEKGYSVGGRYRIIREIGEGGMSVVYLAHDLILDRDVAVKVLKYDLQNNPETTRRFEREAMAISELNHPNIVSIYDVGNDHGMQYLVMEYVDGTNLKEYLRDNFPLPLERIQQIMEQILSAVAHAHSQGIIHRDLKPLNILINKDGNIKISDFGIAMALNDEGMTQTNSVLGTVHYLSPEQARGAQATKQSDIYSLGVILYELLTGSVPFVGETPVSVAIKHSRNDLPSVRQKDPSIPQSFENIISRATAKDPQDRYANVEEMMGDVKTALDSDRINEPKLFINHDDSEATRLIPTHPVSDLDDQDLSKMPEGGILPSEDEPKDSKKPKKKWSKQKKIMVIAGGVTAAIVLIMLLVLLLNRKKNVEVPDVTNMTQAQAVSMLKSKKLNISPKVEKVSDSKVKAGSVIRTDPSADSNVKEGDSIKLFVSTGTPSYKLDDYTFKPFSDVKDRLERHGIKVKVKKKYSDTVKEGLIMNQSVKSSRRISKGSTITLTVSRGQEKVEMIDLTGYSRKSVTDFANDHGLKKIEDPAQYSNDYDKNTVMAQTPASGTKLKKGDEFHVTFSLGPKPQETASSSSSKSSSNDSNSQSNKNENDNEVSFSVNIIIPYQNNKDGDTAPANANPEQNDVKVYLSDAHHNISDLYTEIKIRKDTQITLPFTVEKGQRGQYRVVSDGQLIMSENVTAP